MSPTKQICLFYLRLHLEKDSVTVIFSREFSEFFRKEKVEIKICVTAFERIETNTKAGVIQRQKLKSSEYYRYIVVSQNRKQL